jgi:hypothetical protein
MEKRIILSLLVLAAATGILGAQETPAEQAAADAQETPAVQNAAGAAKGAVSLDLFPLVKGIIWTDSDKDNSMFALAPGFEYLIRTHYTLGLAADLYFGEAAKIDIFYFGLAAHGRWYPQSSGLDKFFIDVGLGFNVFSYNGEIDSVNGGFTGITMSLKAGYKLILGPKFFFEPSMAFVYAKTSNSISAPTPIGWQPGFSIGGAF